jgi:hypothetical protein
MTYTTKVVLIPQPCITCPALASSIHKYLQRPAPMLHASISGKAAAPIARLAGSMLTLKCTLLRMIAFQLSKNIVAFIHQ